MNMTRRPGTVATRFPARHAVLSFVFAALLCATPARLPAQGAANHANPANPTNPANVANGPEQQAGAVVAGDKVMFSLHAAVASISPTERAAIVNQRVDRILSDKNLSPQDIHTVARPNGNVEIALGDMPIIGVTAQDAEAAGQSAEDLAAAWATRLRETLIEVKPLYRPADKEHVSFLPLLLVSALAFAVPLLAARLKRFTVPVVVGEILAGIVIGRSGLHLVHYHSSLQFLAEFGFAYLLFLSGLEVNLRALRPEPEAGDSPDGEGTPRARVRPAAVAILVFSLTLALSGVFAGILTWVGLLRQPWLVMLVLSTTSLGLVVPILKERRMVSTRLGQVLLMAALLADFVTMFLITIVTGWIAQGFTLKLFVGLSIFAVFLAAVRIGFAVQGARRLDHLWEGFKHPTSQTQVRGSLALMLVFVAVAEQLGTEVILGAFLAGVLLSVFGRQIGPSLHEKLETLGYGFFIPIFFIMVGVRFDVLALVTDPHGVLLAVLLVVGAFCIQLGSSLALRLVASWRETVAGGFLLSSRLSLVIATAEIGLRLGLFSEAVHGAIICVALVTCIGGPMGFQMLMPRAAASERVSPGLRGALAAVPDD